MTDEREKAASQKKEAEIAAYQAQFGGKKAEWTDEMWKAANANGAIDDMGSQVNDPKNLTPGGAFKAAFTREILGKLKCLPAIRHVENVPNENKINTWLKHYKALSSMCTTRPALDQVRDLATRWGNKMRRKLSTGVFEERMAELTLAREALA